jgi:hypothetical protein
MNKLLLTAAAISIGPSVATAQDTSEWELVRSSDRADVFLKPSSVTFAKGTAQVLVRINARSGSQAPFAEALMLWKIDCVRDTQATLATYTFAVDGSTMSRRARPEAPELYHKISSVSYAADVRDVLCQYAYWTK